MAKKKETSVIKSYDDADRKLLEMGTSLSRKQELEAQLNQRINALREEFDRAHGEELAELGGKIEYITKHLELFVIEHNEDFRDKRSRELTWGILKLRYNPPSLRADKNDWTAVVKKMEKAGLDSYIDYDPSVRKNDIKKALEDGELTIQEVVNCGIKVSQTEDVKIEPFLEKIKETQS